MGIEPTTSLVVTAPVALAAELPTTIPRHAINRYEVVNRWCSSSAAIRDSLRVVAGYLIRKIILPGSYQRKFFNYLVLRAAKPSPPSVFFSPLTPHPRGLLWACLAPATCVFGYLEDIAALGLSCFTSPRRRHLAVMWYACRSPSASLAPHMIVRPSSIHHLPLWPTKGTARVGGFEPTTPGLAPELYLLGRPLQLALSRLTREPS